ncbi:agmatine deiminase family protein [Marinobacter sp. F4216]|nr:agmatine deiminase family protein [Marinobacter sp. F4216]MBZ2167782.1 agmatine deiminase family protein [Marinobacter sp. F4216]
MTFRRTLPAEWAPQSAVMLTWPHSGTDWADDLPDVEPVFRAIAKAILRFEHLVISCEDERQLQTETGALTDFATKHGLPGRVVSVTAPANDTWARDHGPLTVTAGTEARLLDFGFNAWGGKFEWQQDNELNRRLSDAGAFGSTLLESIDFILEGGSIESDGQGTLLTTSECLLTPTRNPASDRSDIERLLGENLGAERLLWLNHGYLAGDDTDSHIDTLARFCAADHICYVACPDVADEHYSALAAMEEELQEFRQSNGQPYRLTPLPWPEPIYDDDGERLPATYANFLIINGAVLLPTYGVSQDEEAINVMASIFPDREIIPIDCLPLIRQHGSLHCITMQLPAGVVQP